MLSVFLTRQQGPIWALCVFLGLFYAIPVVAQQLGVTQSGVLTISSERLFTDSAFGQRVLRDIEQESALLADENERIVAELSKEEKALTEKRASLEADDFRPLAEAFDRKVQSHRDGQRAKLDALARRSEEARQAFYGLARPVLIDLLRETGASLILERSSVFLSSDTSDITDAAIARINAAIGDGTGLQDGTGE
ncbi:OmpH family outer membrane protein [Rhodobacteraceae bacterium B1Z28]|uniref:OmpH family outer membrane protein n=1 Tax=Ruegeria haliotis TaxID=2747601 RepID=A0ABX2PM38_9RHOB|nr:OmpH family outer membrane protein [Ruegeria haliotis]NVO55182.1 OmpH family outer membrane protein [Ruegeria haliotis]